MKKNPQQQQQVGLLGTMMASMAASLIEPMASSLIEPMASSLIQPAVLSLINIISSKGVIRAGKGQKSGFLPFLAASLILKAIAGKGVARLGKWYNNMDHIDKIFSSASSFKQYEDYWIFYLQTLV